MPDTTTASSNPATIPPSKRLLLKGLMTSLTTPHISKAPSKALRWLSKQWSNLLLSACVAAFLGVTMFAVSLTDNYTCSDETYTVRGGESPWSIALQRCSGSTEHAMRDILSINGAAPYDVGMVVIVPESGG